MAKDADVVSCPNCDNKNAILIDGCITCLDCGYDEAYEKEFKEIIRESNIKEYEEYN